MAPRRQSPNHVGQGMGRGVKSPRRHLRRAMIFACRASAAGFFLGVALFTYSRTSEIVEFSALPQLIAPALARDDQDDMRREAREAERDMRRQQKEQEREARRQQREVEQEAKRQQREAEQDAKRQQREAEKEASNQQRSQPRDERPEPSKPDVPKIGHWQDDNRPQSVPVKLDAKDDSKPASKGNFDSGKSKLDVTPKGKPEREAKTSRENKAEYDDADEQPLSPPRTMVEVFERMAAPAQPKPAKAPDVVPAKTAAVPAKPVKNPVAGQKTLVPSIKRGAPDFELLQQGMFRPHEVLATHLSAADQKSLEAQGFKTVSSVVAPGDTGAVSRLVIPSGMTETAAMQLLEGAAPTAQFGPNHVYRIVPAADAPAAAAAPDGMATTRQAAKKDEDTGARAAACAAGECFARDMLAWKPSTKNCARRVRVGLIDTSFDVAHPAFAGRKFSVEQFSGSQTIARGDWHGTAVLSVLAGNASSSTPGLIPDADFYLASTFRADAQGNAAADSISVLKALAWLDKRDVNLVNMSFSGPRNDQIEVAIAAMAAKGVVFVAAAGNKGPSAPPSYPAAYPQVVAVTAVGKKLNSYLHANRGGYVDVAAPGVQVLTALPEGRQGFRTGTSFAAPFITGLLAAMPAVRKGATDKEDMLSRISFQDLGEPGRDTIYGEGLPKAPERCNDVGGVASLPWTNAAKRMSVGAPTASESALARPASQ